LPKLCRLLVTFKIFSKICFDYCQLSVYVWRWKLKPVALQKVPTRLLIRVPIQYSVYMKNFSNLNQI
jgi:hypothetical protein